jgi:hypothetical protein
MKENATSKFSKGLRRVAIAIVTIGIAVGPAVHAKPNSKRWMAGNPAKIILVRPTDLPELAQQTGEAMLLHETSDGSTFLYIEQNHGSRLAIFDVTDPSKIKGEDSVRLDAPGPFDFVFPVGDRAELVRFRKGQGEAVLDFHKVKVPTIRMVQGLKFQGIMERLGDDGFILVNQANGQSAPNVRDYQVVETANSQEPSPVFDVERVREEITNDSTGTTFLLTADGLYLIRRPAAEEDFKTQLDLMNHPG